jgi:hypothetical protein
MRNEHAGRLHLVRQDTDRQTMRVINNEELNSGTLRRQIESEIV